jgi:hypothetical protein
MGRTAYPIAIFGLLLLGALTVLGAEEQPAQPEHSQEQVRRLQDLFIEAVSTRDWKKLEATAEGLKATGLQGADLEVIVLRGERDAAFSGRCLSGQVITWGLSCRVLAGDPKAQDTLRELAREDPAPAAMPNQELWAKDREAAAAAMKEYHAGLKALGQRDEALLCLALLKEPGVSARAQACLAAHRTAHGAWYGMGRSDTLIMAVLLGSPEDGWERLSAMLTGEGKPEAQLRVLQGMMSLLPSNRARWVRDGKEPVSVDAQVSELLPKEAEEQLLKAYAAMLGRYPVDAANVMSINGVLMLAYTLPKQDAGSEIVKAVEALKERIGENNPDRVNVLRMIDAALGRLKGEVPVWPPAGPGKMEPPKAQADF